MQQSHFINRCYIGLWFALAQISSLGELLYGKEMRDKAINLVQIDVMPTTTAHWFLPCNGPGCSAVDVAFFDSAH